MNTVLRRVGMFGGAFDPPHRTHVAIAQAAIAQLRLDLLYVLPTGQAWHKQRVLSAPTQRLAMCQLAFADTACAVVDARETRRSGPSYTIDTLQELQTEHPQARLFVLIGEDQALALQSWHRTDDVLGTATLCVASRPGLPGTANGLPPTAQALQGVAFETLHIAPSPISATEIRQRCAQRLGIATMVPEPVARYIDLHHLYRTD